MRRVHSVTGGLLEASALATMGVPAHPSAPATLAVRGHCPERDFLGCGQPEEPPSSSDVKQSWHPVTAEGSNVGQ